MGKDVETAVRHHLDEGEVPSEIAGEALHQDGGILILHQLDGLGEVVHAEVLEIVPEEKKRKNRIPVVATAATKRRMYRSTVVMTM